MFDSMRGLRKFIRTRSSGGLLAVCIAYALAVEGLMASVGFGMAAAAAPGHAGFVLCSFASGPGQPGPGTDGGRQHPRPQCPFCFIAAQSAGHFATMGAAPAFPSYAALQIANAVSDRRGDDIAVLRLRHSRGEARAPPVVSV